MTKKIFKFVSFVAIGLLFCGCTDLDMNPLSSGSTESWYSTADEIRMAVNEGYRKDFLLMDGDQIDEADYRNNTDWSDDTHYRQLVLPFQNATVTSQEMRVRLRWQNNYKVVTRMNEVINNYQRAINAGYSENEIMPYVGEAYFFRARAYGELVFHWGDVPYYTSDISISDAEKKGRASKDEVLKHVYEDFDRAIELLPVISYSGDQRVTKGAAYAFKARYALYMDDYKTAAAAAKSCMDSGVYSLESDYSKLFLPETKTSPEFVFIMPRSIESKLNVISNAYCYNRLIRNAGGWGTYAPSWELLAAYTCTDGKPIDESPLFDSHSPFKNRDPRCEKTIVAFNSYFLGYEYDPSPVALTCGHIEGTDTVQVYNNDTRANKFYASFNGLIWRKGVSQSWIDNGYKGDNPKILMRYADVLLMYAEAKIELNQIDQSVIDAMNQVRARAYGVDKSQKDKYPAFTIKEQAQMRYDLRVERRMELAGENLRYPDLIRWKLAQVVFKRKAYMLLPPDQFKEQLYDKGNWFWGLTPDIDQYGTPDFSKLEAADMCSVASEYNWDDRQYLWPIPEEDVENNPNMKQNEGY